MQQSRGEWARGGNPAGARGPRAGTAEPVTLVDLDGAVTRIAALSTWTREQVRHPGDDPLFITHLEQGQLWHRAVRGAKTWAHEVQVGPATVVSEGGQFHVVAEPDGGATITCIEGQVAVATQFTSAILLAPNEAVAVTADGETCVIHEASFVHAIESGPAGRQAWPAARRAAGSPSPARRWIAATSRPAVITALLALVAALLVVLIGLVLVR